MKRYLSTTTVAQDGVIVVKCDFPFAPTKKLIVVPRQVLDGLLTAIHLKLSHPSKHQLKLVVRRNFFALNIDHATERVTDACHTCTSLKSIPTTLIEQTTTDAPEAIGVSFAADVIKRNRQLIFVVRETVSSYTSTCIVESERHDALRDCLARLCMELRPLEGPPAIIRVDPAPGFVALMNDPTLLRLGIRLEIGRIKNPNKNPVAEKAVSEVEDELLRQEPGGGPVSPLILAIATSQLNSRIRGRGLSAREIWFQRDQFSNTQLPISDRAIITEQHRSRLQNHTHSQTSKAPRSKEAPVPMIHVGDLVHVLSDRSKSQARDRYLVTSIEDSWCYIRKFSGSQLRTSSYKVRLSECYLVPGHVSTTIPPHHREDEDDTEDAPPYEDDTPHDDQANATPPEIPLMIAAPPEPPLTITPKTYTAALPKPPPTPSDNVRPTRPIRRRNKPAYLQDYEW